MRFFNHLQARHPLALLLLASISLLAASRPCSAHAQTGYRVLRAIPPPQQVADLAVGPDGLLYAGVRGGIQVSTTRGQLVREISSSDLEVALQVSSFSPSALAFDRDGILHAMNGLGGLVARFRDGSLVSSFTVEDPSAPQRKDAYDMAIASDGTYFFITAGPAENSYGLFYGLQKHDASGNHLFTIPKESISSDLSARLSAVALSGRGDVHVVVHAQTGVSVEVFSSTGLHLRRLKMPKGIDPESIFNIASDQAGNIVVNTRLNSREPVLVTFSPEGVALKTNIGGFEHPAHLATMGHFEDLSGLAFDALGNLYTSSQLSSEPIVAYKLNPSARIFFRLTPERRSKSRTAEFKFATDRGSDTFECSLDGAPFAVCSSTKRYSQLRRGKHSFRVRVRGENRTTKTERWTVL